MKTKLLLIAVALAWMVASAIAGGSQGRPTGGAAPGTYEPAAGNPAGDGYVWASTSGGTRSWKDPGTLIITSIKDSIDPTKIAAFDLTGISTGTTRTLTLPDANIKVPIVTQFLTFSGPTSARTITLPDSNFTAARTDAGNTFTGTQTITTQSGTSAITGGASDMTITSGTGNSRLMVLKTTTSGGTATAALTLNSNQSGSFGGSCTIPTNEAFASADFASQVKVNAGTVGGNIAIVGNNFYPASSGITQLGISGNGWKSINLTAVPFSSAISSPAEGTIQAFSDSNTATPAATITGGSTHHVLGYFDGVNWTVIVGR